MKFVQEKNETYAVVGNKNDVNDIFSRIEGQEQFAFLFKFSDRSLMLELLNSLNADLIQFSQKYFYYDPARKLHISENQSEYVWISTLGLIARKKKLGKSSCKCLFDSAYSNFSSYC